MAIGTEPQQPQDAADLAAAVLEEEARRQAEQRRDDDAPVQDELLAGVGGESVSLRQVVRAGGAPLITMLSALVLLDHVDTAAFAVLGPDIQKSLGMSDLVLGVIGALGGLVVF